MNDAALTILLAGSQMCTIQTEHFLNRELMGQVSTFAVAAAVDLYASVCLNVRKASWTRVKADRNIHGRR